MTTHAPFTSPNFRAVAKRLIALHRLIKADAEDSPEAEAIRDSLDTPLATLSQADKVRAQWLSEDLYSLSEPSSGSGPTPVSSPEPFIEAVIEAAEARHRGDWDRALELLRRRDGFASPAQVSYLRGAIWLDAGFPEIAVEFFAHAAASKPSSAKYRDLHQFALRQSGADAAA